ncbi:MAG: ATPase domain-containing protein [Burkholderiaceae bacterium]
MTNEPSERTRAQTGVHGLDDILHGGLIADRLYLVDGNPGAGKTTLALQFLLEGLRRGEPTMYVTLSETADELRDGAASHGWSLDGIRIIELHGEEAGADAADELTIFHPSELELSNTTRKVLVAVERHAPKRMVFDSLSELRLLAQSSLRYRRQILALKQFFAGRACTTLFLDDRTADGSDLQLQSIAHGVISLEHRAPVYGRALRHLRVVKFRGSDFRTGYHHLRLLRGGLEVYPRLTASDHGEDFDAGHLASGIDSLDNLLGGGIDTGTSTLIVGPAGSGKSTIALQYAIAATQRGDHAVVFTFDESRQSILQRLRGMGMRAQGGLEEVAICQVDPAEISPGEFSHMVRRAVEVDRARVVVIDSLNGYVNAMVDGHYLTAQLHELLSFAGNHGVSTFVIAAQSGMLAGQMGAPGEASYLADTVIYTRFFEHAGQLRKAISVMKKRSGPHEQTIRELQFDGKGIRLSEPLRHFRGVLTGVPVETRSAESTADDEPRATARWTR